MTITSETCTITVEGDGSNTEFGFNFLIPYQADGVTPAVAAYITVDGVRTDLTLDTEYSITGTGDAAGGTVTYPLSGDPLDTPNTLTIGRAVDYVQPYEFPQQGFRPTTVGELGDWLAMQLQQINYRLDTIEGVLEIEPFPFDFGTFSNVDEDTFVEGNEDTLDGPIDPTALYDISVSNGSYSLNGGEFTMTRGTIRKGDRVKPGHTTPASPDTHTVTAVTVGETTSLFETVTGEITPPPPEGTVVNNTAELTAAMNAAVGGETFLCAPGSYTSWYMRGKVYASEVLVTAQDPEDLPLFSNIFLREMEKVRVSFVEVVLTAPSADAVTLQDCVDCAFEDSVVRGPSADLSTILTTVKCIFVRTCTNTVVQRNECKWTSHGISHLACDFLDILDNRCHDLQSDGIRGGGSNDVNIERNFITGLYPPTQATHPDGIQFWTTNVTRLTERLVIRNNTFIRGDGRYAQGIFLRDQVGSGYDDVLIVGNAVVGGTFNGINPQGYAYPVPVGKVGFTNCSINDNLCLGYVDQSSSIFFRAVASGAYADNQFSDFKTGAPGSCGPLTDGGGQVQLSTTTPVGDLTQFYAWVADGHTDNPVP